MLAQATLDDSTLNALRARELKAPRYTSYPTALAMRPELDFGRVLHELERSNEEPIPGDLSLYLHIPFCASACFYCGCNRIISSRQPRHIAYLQHLRREIAAVARRVRKDRRVCQIHLGGGTPNMLDPKLLHGLLDELIFFDRASIPIAKAALAPALVTIPLRFIYRGDASDTVAELREVSWIGSGGTAHWGCCMPWHPVR